MILSCHSLIVDCVRQRVPLNIPVERIKINKNNHAKESETKYHVKRF